MDKTLGIAQTVFAILLVVAILLQNRGAGLSDTFGGSGNIYQTKRGFDKFLFIATIVLAVAFVGTAFVSFIKQY
ncbi:MAG: preprotein translocase subunit SecG [Candidatus Paceibacterota bacterium]|jgi:preprotein translocase subunit SecG